MISPPVLAACPSVFEGPATGPIVSSSVNSGGINWQVDDLFALFSQSGDASFAVDTVSVSPTSFPLTTIIAQLSFDITAVNQGTKTFTVGAIDLTTILVNGLKWSVLASTGNDQEYTIDSFALNGGDTDITVIEAIPDATADGSFYFYGVMSIDGDHVAAFTEDLFVVTDNTDGLNNTYHYQEGVTDYNFGASGETRVFVDLASAYSVNTGGGNLQLLHEAAVVTYHTISPGTAYETTNNIAAGAQTGAGTGLTLDIVV